MYTVPMYTASFREVSGTYNYKSSLLSSEASAISETSYFSCAFEVCLFSESAEAEMLESREISLSELMVMSAEAYCLLPASLLIVI